MQIMNQSRTTSFLTAVLAMAALPLAADTFVREDVQSFDAAALARVAASTGSGDIAVAVWDKPVVEVKVLMSVRAKNEETANQIFDRVEVVYDQEGDALAVDVKAKPFKSFFNLFSTSPKVNLTIMCPANIDIKAGSGSGDVELSGVNGDHKLNSGSGDIRVEQVSGKVDAGTGSGDVTAKSVSGFLKTGSGSGDINVKNLQGQLDAGSGSGDVDASGAITSFEAGTGSGDVEITTSVAVLNDSKASSGSGDVTVSLPAAAAFSLDAETVSGSVSCTFTLDAATASKRSLAGSVHGGGPVVRLRSGSGDLTVKGQ